MRRGLLCMVLSLCIFMLSSCSSDTSTASVSESTSLSVTSVSETESFTQTTEKTETASETPTKMTEIASETSEQSVSETISETTATETSVTETTPSETVASVTESETTVQTTVETTVPATEQTTTEKVTEKPKAEVIIPEIKTPLASGSKAETNDKGEIDFSCANEGYISAVYTGKSTRAKLRVKCGDLQYDHDLVADGTREFFPLMESGSYSVKIYELVVGKSYGEAVSAEFEVKIKSSTGMYLYPNKYVNFDSKSNCVRKAAELCAGIDNDVEKIAEIFGYVAGNTVYDKELAATVKSGYIPDPDKTLKSGTGLCFDYSSLMAAMCRSQGIPTRLVIGYAESDIYHAWNEVYTSETGWITPELFLKKKGYNIADATFYAGNPDKEKIADYIEDDSNYSAMYRY